MNFSPVQTFIAKRATIILADKLKTKVSIDRVKIGILNSVTLEGLYVEGRNKDTLLYAGEMSARITDWFIFSDKPVIKYIGLKNTFANLYRTSTSDEWNFQFIIDAFDNGKKSTTTKKQNDFDIGLEKVRLENVRFHMDDAWIGADKDFEIGSFLIDANKVDFKKKILDIDKIVAKRTAVMIRDYDGGRPPRAKKPSVIDTTPFNKGNWLVKLNKLSLEDCVFSSDQDKDMPTPNLFDPQHIGVKAINAEAKDITIVGDTIRGKMTFSAKERSGFIVKKLKADVFVSPNASICDNLYLETNNSILQRYYAMHYTRFPDFKNYIDKVVMVGDFKNASIDANDVGYFAPSVRQFKTIVKANGFVAGTVDSLTSKNLNVTDGNMIVKGDLRMIGLPDINSTWIDYKNGEIYTNGQAIFRYAPKLKDNPNLALEKVTHAYFKGNYVGYIDNFIANGTLITNLGTITSDVKMNIPDMNQARAVYSGTVKSDNFDIGTLLRIKDLGAITMRAKVQGNAFDPEIAKINVDGFIDRITYHGYTYQNINADGVVERNKFDGNLLIDDPNLAFAFYGQLKVVDKQLNINATANLLKSDFRALNLTKDSLTATADIDLNWVGTNFDNFLGYVKLYNINVLRFGNRLDLDSIYVQSDISPDSQKLVTIESNALTAKLSGKYQITKLHKSVIFYLSKYLPNYIQAPTTYAPDQDLTFAITTHRVENLLGVLIPNIKGFDNSVINGSLNTNEQSLSLNARIPYGSIGKISMRNISVNGDGDFRLLGLNAEAERIVLGDSILNGAVSVTTTLGNDSMIFNIATNSREALGTATINGRAYAQNDSLYFNLMASEFYWGGTKWEISDGSNITLAKKYLYTKDINIHSGPQQITINSDNMAGDAPIYVDIKNIDVGQITTATKLAEKTSGTINGSIKLEHLWDELLVTGNIKATDVVYGPDTLGNIIVDGTYDAKKNAISLDPKSGMYKGNSSMTVGGVLVLFDSTSRQRVDGTVQFNNAPLTWLGPIVTGYVSNLNGTLQGTVHIKGVASEPDVNGSVKMDNAHAKIDFLGTEYDMSPATITLNNQEINFGNITLQDIYKNNAILAGKITHDRFKNLELNFNVGSSKFQVLNLKENENETFYGNLIVGFRNLSVRGPVDDIRIRISSARPADKSHLFIPIGGPSVSTNYSYVSFKTNAADSQVVVKKKSKNKLYINIDAILNELAEITLVLDPSTGDAINATGTGNLNMEIPLGNDIRMYGVYEITHGDYTFTLKQLFFKRKFDLNAGSRINFNGLISQTEMNVQGVYTTRTRLYDLLNAQERTVIEYDQKEARETKAPQNVNVLLYMNGSLEEPKLSFKLDLPDKRAAGTLAYAKLESYNQDPKLLFNQVAGLLLIGSFIPENGTGGDNTGSATAGAISNISEILSGTASSQLTNIVSKITGDQNLSFDLKYKAYNYYNTNSAGTGLQDNLRNELTFGFTKNYFNDRLTIELGSAYDWGRPTSASNKTSNFNPVGDFRMQYLFREGGNVRGYIFRTSSYDVIGEKNLNRGGVGISWRKSFDNFEEFFHGERYARKKLLEEQQRLSQPVDTASQRTGGTW